MKELLIPPPPSPSKLSDRASFNRAHASNALPNVAEAVDREASAERYAFAVERRSVYAVCEASRSDLLRTE
jgi:hypothetical protein